MERIPRFTDADLAGLSLPVQVIVGSDDALLNSRETRQRLERWVPHARVMALEKVGHILPPQTATVAEFLESIRTVEETRATSSASIVSA